MFPRGELPLFRLVARVSGSVLHTRCEDVASGQPPCLRPSLALMGGVRNNELRPLKAQGTSRVLAWGTRRAYRSLGRPSAAAPFGTDSVAARLRFRRRPIVFAFCVFGVAPQCAAGARERRRFFERDQDAGRDELEMRSVRLFTVNQVGLLANRSTDAAPQDVPVVIFHLQEWPSINDGVFMILARTLIALVGCDRDVSKFDTLDRPPRRLLALKKGDAVEAGLLECLQKYVFPEGAGDASAPKVGVRLEMVGNLFIAHDI